MFLLGTEVLAWSFPRAWVFWKEEFGIWDAKREHIYFSLGQALHWKSYNLSLFSDDQAKSYLVILAGKAGSFFE